SYAATRRRVAWILVTMIAVALPMLLVRYLMTPTVVPQYTGRTLVHQELDAHIQRAQNYRLYAEGQLLARHVFTQATELHDPPHIIAQNRARAQASADLRQNIAAANDASTRAARAERRIKQRRADQARASAQNTEA